MPRMPNVNRPGITTNRKCEYDTREAETAAREEAVGHDPCDVVQAFLERHGIKDLESVDVQDDIAVVGLKALAQDGLAP